MYKCGRFLRKLFSGKIRNIGWKCVTKHTFFKNVSASGQMIPTPCVSILHPPRAPQVPYTPKIDFVNIPILLYVYPIDPFKGLEAMVGIARSKVICVDNPETQFLIILAKASVCLMCSEHHHARRGCHGK